MGQYYKIAYRIGNKTRYNGRKLEGCNEYIMAKLMEHSYLGNWLMDSVAKFLENNKVRLAWVGDYAEQSELDEICKGKVSYENVWGDKAEKYNEKIPLCKKFSYKGKYLVNKTKKVYISFDKYRKLCKTGGLLFGMTINPISILTVIGNGRGGGDYDGTNMDYVGSWAWDLITICGKEDLPEKFIELNLSFNENLN